MLLEEQGIYGEQVDDQYLIDNNIAREQKIPKF